MAKHDGLGARQTAVDVEFPADDDAGVPAFRDRLFVDEGTAESDLATMARERYDAFRSVILDPPPLEEPAPVDPTADLVDALTSAEAALARVRESLAAAGLDLPALNRAARRRLARG